MKNKNRLMLTLLVTFMMSFSSNAMAASLEIDFLILRDNSVLKNEEISLAHFNLNRSLDYVELKDGSRVEGTDVLKVIIKSRFGVQAIGDVFRAGDGSGG